MIAAIARLAAALAMAAGIWLALSLMATRIGDALAQAGPLVVVALAAVHAVSMFVCSLAWAQLAPGQAAARYVLLRWVRDGFNELWAILPLAGEAAALRLLALQGIKPGPAAAGMVVDLTAEVAAQIVFSLAGLALWAQWPGAGPVVRWGIIGGVAAMATVAAFVALQHGGGLRLADILAARFTAAGVDLHAQVLALYRRKRRVAAATALHVLAWLAACAEAWVGLILLGHPMPVLPVLMLECAVFALRSAAFAVPGALGVQEGAYALLAPLLGIPAEIAVTLSLLKRGREVLLGLPAIITFLRLTRRRRRLPGAPAASPSSGRR